MDKEPHPCPKSLPQVKVFILGAIALIFHSMFFLKLFFSAGKNKPQEGQKFAFIVGTIGTVANNSYQKRWGDNIFKESKPSSSQNVTICVRVADFFLRGDLFGTRDVIP